MIGGSASSEGQVVPVAAKCQCMSELLVIQVERTVGGEVIPGVTSDKCSELASTGRAELR